jgi:hypothetical protein
MALARVTLTLDRRLVEEARIISGGNFSRFVSRLLEEELAELRRQKLREALRVGYQTEADHDLEIAEEYRFVDSETAMQEVV